MCAVFITASKSFTLFHLDKDGCTCSRVPWNKVTLLPASYIVLSEGISRLTMTVLRISNKRIYSGREPVSVQITNECCLRRIISNDSSSKLTTRVSVIETRVAQTFRERLCLVVSVRSKYSCKEIY
jgi:hypothetical protein